ncbi:MAG: HAD family phosphatase [Pseudobutyrivibrio sp.]|nr:HAD family phosphatase [Pseudobutyrivibrio sp.]
MKDIRVIGLDLDGTLTTSEKKITSHTKEVIRRAIVEKDVKIVLASGRPVVGIVHVAKELELDKLGGYILAYNGGEILDAKTMEVIDSTYLDKSTYETICDVYKKFPGVSALTYEDNEILTAFPENKYVAEEVRCCNVGVRKANDLYERVKERDLPKFLEVGAPELLPPVKDYLEPLIGDKADVFFSCPFFLECVPKGIEKGSKLATLTKKLGFTTDNLMVCGDAPNDITMLQTAGLGVAMANGYDEVKAVADYITLTNDEDGVAAAIEKFALGL